MEYGGKGHPLFLFLLSTHFSQPDHLLHKVIILFEIALILQEHLEQGFLLGVTSIAFAVRVPLLLQVLVPQGFSSPFELAPQTFSLPRSELVQKCLDTPILFLLNCSIFSSKDMGSPLPPGLAAGLFLGPFSGLCPFAVLFFPFHLHALHYLFHCPSTGPNPSDTTLCTRMLLDLSHKKSSAEKKTAPII